MNLGAEFLSQIENRSLKPNVVVVFSPPGRFFTTTQSNKPNSNSSYNGTGSFIFWKHEPDAIFDTTEAVFSNHLMRRIGGDVPLNCIDSVSISGSEVDLKDATTPDDSVDINTVFNDVSHKSFFQSIIGYNVEVYLGFRDAAYQFEDYERFYVGALRSVVSNDSLSLSLKVGNIADYWNKIWQHSEGLQPTKLAYAYPLDEAFQKEGDGTPWGSSFKFLSWRPEWALRQIGDNLKPWGFDYKRFSFKKGNIKSTTEANRYFMPTSAISSSPTSDRRAFWLARPEYKLPLRYEGWTQFQILVRHVAFGLGVEGRPDLLLRRYEPFYPTSMFIFQPSGTIQNVIDSAPELVSDVNVYPNTDAGFLRAIREPGVTNRIRFKVGTTVVESSYIDSVAVYPYWAEQINQASNLPDQYIRNLVHHVTRGRPPSTATLNNGYRFYLRFQGGIKFSQFEQPAEEDASTAANPDPYTLDRQTLVNLYGGPIPRFNFATKLKIFTRKKVEVVEFNGNKYDLPKPPEFSAGEPVQFYDLNTGIGQIGTVIYNTLLTNIGISSFVLDLEAFQEATNNYFVGVNAPRQLRGGFFNSDYAFSGGDDEFTEYLEEKVLKSNNLRLISDGGVLRLIYLGLTNLREKQNGDDPFLLSEDDLIESTVYETRQQDYVSRLKVRVGFHDLENEAGASTFYVHDNRSPDRRQGRISVFQNPPNEINQLDHEEIDLYTNFTLGTSLTSPSNFGAQREGMVGPLFYASPFDFKKYVEDFARDYFNVNNPFIRLTIVAGPRAIAVDVGEIIVLRDHKAIEMFGSQFIKVLVVNKSINNWGTEAIQVTLDCLFISRSLDYLETGDVDAPSNLRLVTKVRNTARPYAVTDATVTWDAPQQWGQNEDEELYAYEVVESTSAGERVLFKLAADTNSSEEGRYNWVASTRQLSISLDNPNTYHIFVRADNGVKKSKASNVLSIETFSQSVRPSAPNMLTGVKDGRVAVLEWRPPSNLGNEPNLSYNLYVNGELFLNVGGSENYRYAIEGEGAQTISFYVTAQNSQGESDPSNTVTLDFEAPRPTPTGSINLSTIENGTSAIRLVITHNLNDADSLEINRNGVLIRTIDVGTSPQNFEDLGLEANTRYCYRVIAVNDSGAGVESNESCARTLEDIVQAVPGPVRSLRSTDVQTDSIEIGWLAPNNEGSSEITHYNVCWSTDNSNFTCVNETDVDHEFTSLSMSTTYYLRVSAVNAVGEGPRELIIVDTLGTGVRPTQPTITAEQTEYDSPFEITVNLALPNLTSDVITSYVIERSTDNVSFAVVSTNNSPAASNSYTDTSGLVDGSTYYYRARTTNSVGNSVYSDVVSVEVVDCEKREAVISDITARFKDATELQKQTGSWILYDRTMDVDGEGTDDPCGGYDFNPPRTLSKVRNLTLLLAHTTDADIEWDAPRFLGGYPIARYEVQVVGQTFVENVTAENTTVMNLQPATRYTVRVRPVNTFGSIGPWASVSFTTLGQPRPPTPNLPGAPSNLRIQTSHSAIDKTFEWDAPSDLGMPPLFGYRLTLNNSEFLIGPNTTHRITNLLYNTDYTARVRANNFNNNQIGIGPFSEEFNFTTGEGVPAPPRNIRLSVVDETSIKVDWNEPRVTNGTITGYSIYYRELLSGDAWTRVNVGNVLTNTIEGFEKGKTYEFDMSASTSAGESVVTGSPVQITISQYSVPGAPSISCDQPPPPPE